MSVDFDADDVETPHERADIRCPDCGAEPTDESIRNVHLSSLGYFHGDMKYQCMECEASWTHGVPVGDGDSPLADDLVCDKCDGRYLVHRVEPDDDTIMLHLKCPECYAFERVHREWSTKRILVGYPQTTGELNPDRPDGFTSDGLAEGSD